MQTEKINYIVTNHAIERAVTRLNIDEAIAADYIRFLFAGSIEQGVYGNAHMHIHEATGIRILTDLFNPVIITIYDNVKDSERIAKITNPRLKMALEQELAELIRDTQIDLDCLEKQQRFIAGQILILEIEAVSCKSEKVRETLYKTVETHMQSLENIEQEIGRSMAIVERANAEICALCA